MPSENKNQVYRIALAGNPNSGKTTIFNALTGAHQHVGNYPGVTVERRAGEFTIQGHKVQVVDLPGTYSLSSYSPEEKIAQEELLGNRFDAVVVVVDSLALRRSLVFLAQIMQTGANPVLCLNMSDEADKAGLRIDVPQLRKLLGFPVVRTVGHKASGLDHLRQAILEAIKHPVRKSRLVLGRRMEDAIVRVCKPLQDTGQYRNAIKWVATRLLVDDDYFVQRVRMMGQAGIEAVSMAAQERQRIESDTGIDIRMFLSQRYYGFVDGLLAEVITRHPNDNARAVSNAIDRVLANRIMGFPIFIVILYGIFWLTFTAGAPPMEWIASGFSLLGHWISGFWPAGSHSALKSLLVDGIIGGVGGVLVFVPNILLLFFGLALLEDTGYMARAAFLMDRIMHKFGLHGQSFIPMITGFGCSVPAIMATRTLENERDRLTTMMVIPLMSCGARLPIWMLLIPAFFPQVWRAPMLFFIYAFGVIMALLMAKLLRKTVLKGDDAPFVMELPPYRMPTLKAVLMKMWEETWMYIKKAGTIILGVSIVMWFISSYPKKHHYVVDREVAAGTVHLSQAEIRHRRAAEDLSYSIAGRIGRFLEPAIRPLGFDWRIGTAIIGAFAAKEVFVSQMGIIYSLGETNEHSKGLRSTLAHEYSPLVGFSLMLFMLLTAPCMATVAATRKESGSWRWALFQLFGLTALAYTVSLVVYQVGRLFLT